jgi:hypothetical protein
MLRISKEYSTRLLGLRQLAAEIRHTIVGELNRLPLGFSFEEGVRGAIQKAGVVDTAEQEDILRAIVGLHYYYASSGLDQSKFLDEIVNTVVLSTRQDFQPDGLTLLRNVFSEFLDVTPLRVSTKASSLLTDGERGFIRAKVITDIRPVFGERLSDPEIEAAFALHTLRITYHSKEGGEFHVSMCTRDLIELKKVIDRAILKAEGLSKVMPRISSNILEPE